MSNESIREKNLNRILYITRVGVLSALAVILFLYGNFPIFPVFPFNVLKLDFASVPTLLAGFALGPMAGAITVVIKVGIKLLVDPTTTMYVGELADFISSLAFVLPAACLYKYKKSISGAVIGLSIGVVLNALITSIANYALIVPIYVKLMPFLAETFTEKVRLQFAFGYGLAFNGIRTVSCSVITLAVYKRLRFLLKETASERDKKQADKKTLNETHPRKPSFLGMKFRQITRPLLPFMAFGAVVLRVWAWKNFDYRVKKAELKAARKMLDKGAGLILTAHNGPTDIIVPVLVGRRKMALAARTYAFPSEFYTKLFYFTGNCVERQDIELDIGFIKEVKSRIDGGISTLIYPDARYSRNGIVDVAPFDGIPKLAKYLKCPIVCIKTPGVYLTRAFYRVERGFFKGHIDCDITSISKEDVQKLSIQELKDLIRSAVDGNDYEWQEQNNAEFHSKKYSQTVCLESILYKAPVCGAEFNIQTNDDNTIQCNACGTKNELLANGRFVSRGGDEIFPRVDKWHIWEKVEFERQCKESENYEISFPATYLPGTSIRDTVSVKGEGIFTLNKDGYSFKGKTNEGEDLDFHYDIPLFRAVTYRTNVGIMFVEDKVHPALFNFEKVGTAAKYEIALEVIFSENARLLAEKLANGNK